MRRRPTPWSGEDCAADEADFVTVGLKLCAVVISADDHRFAVYEKDKSF